MFWLPHIRHSPDDVPINAGSFGLRLAKLRPDYQDLRSAGVIAGSANQRLGSTKFRRGYQLGVDSDQPSDNFRHIWRLSSTSPSSGWARPMFGTQLKHFGLTPPISANAGLFSASNGMISAKLGVASTQLCTPSCVQRLCFADGLVWLRPLPAASTRTENPG